ncbi:MAG TPA: ABC transporter permease [Spirochaetota bacterium]|nr:ABC transporter permease [Spirochaetota bacterium]HPN82923.1 ABC transporter permease [Spirochaetota bacterium]
MSPAMQRFFANRTGKIGLGIVGFFVLLAILAPVLANDAPIVLVRNGEWFFPAIFDHDEFANVDWQVWLEKEPYDSALMPPVPFSPVRVRLDEALLPPGEKGHLLGTDNLGYDILARIIHGSRIALSVGIVAMGIAALIGLVLGSLAGYFGGSVDILISRLIEIVICFPLLFLILTVLAFLPPSIYNIMIVIGITSWTGIARLVRGEILKVREMDYVKAARAAGYPDRRIISHHVLPNALAPVFVSISFGIAGSILTETALSFLGFGVQPPDPSWGQILSLAREYPSRIWFTIFPGLAIFLTVTGYNMIGEALRDALDPRLARRE